MEASFQRWLSLVRAMTNARKWMSGSSQAQHSGGVGGEGRATADGNLAR